MTMKIYGKTKGLMPALLVMLAVSCSERDDYNSMPDQSLQGMGNTVWENICGTAELSDFASIIERAGFAEELQSSKVYTVWAPQNGTFDVDALAGETKENLLNRFVKNHVAFYRHNLKNGERKRIQTLNSKSFDFTPQMFGEQAVLKLNAPGSNGSIHIIDGRQKFYPNLYEYITTATGIDSVQRYYKKFETVRLDENASVPGPVVGGKQTYIDSVMITGNSLFRRLNAYVNREDSSYTALLPTDDAWKKACKCIRPYFNYVAKTAAQDFSVANQIKIKTCNVDAALYCDSMTRNVIISNMFFNNSHRLNRWLAGGVEPAVDSLFSTSSVGMGNGMEMLSRTLEVERMSNGMAHIVDSLAFSPNVWAPDIIVAGNRSNLRARTLSAVPEVVRVSEEELGEGKEYVASYLDLVPSGSVSLPDVYFYLPDVLSTTYEVVAVIVPADIKKGYAGEVKPNKFTATVTYSDAKGALKSVKLTAPDGNTYFVSNTEQVDYISLGQVTFPVCYRGIGSYYPTLEIKSYIKNIFDKKELNAFDRELRIAAVFLRPVIQ